MLKKTVTYTDFEGISRKEDHYFNLTKAEMLEYDVKFAEQGGVLKYLTYLVENEKQNELFQAFKDLILRAYGERNASGRFIKNQEIRDAFASSEAYSELFMEVVASEENATAFINGLFSGIPEVKKALDAQSNVTPIPAPIG